VGTHGMTGSDLTEAGIAAVRSFCALWACASVKALFVTARRSPRQLARVVTAGSIAV